MAGAGTINLQTGGVLSGLTATGTGGTLNIIGGNNTLSGDINLGGATLSMNKGTINTVTVDKLTMNGKVNMDVNLQNQTADKLVVESSYTGNTTLGLTNIATTANATTGDGIKLIDFADDATVNGTFSLVGGKWDQGAYEYKLHQGEGSDQDYYLRSGNGGGSGGDDPSYSDAFKTMLNIPMLNVIVAQTGMNSLQRRLGDLRNMDNTNKRNGVWVRNYYKDMTVSDLIDTDMNLFGGEAGYDWLFRADEPTKLYAGVLVGYVKANGIKTKKNNGMYEKGEGDAPTIGVYATLMDQSGWFADIAARNFWTKLDMKNHPNGTDVLTYKPKRNLFTVSAEVGKSIENRTSRNDYVRIEPKAELSYLKAGKDTAEVSDGSELAYDSANYINAKAAILLSYNHIRNNGLIIEPLLELAYRYEFAGEGDVTYDGVTEKTSLKGGTAEINAGLNMQFTKDLYFYALGSYEAGEKMKGWGVHAGIRYTFGEDGNNYRPTQQRYTQTQYTRPTNTTQRQQYIQTQQRYTRPNSTQTQTRYAIPTQTRYVTTQQTTYTQPTQTRYVTQQTYTQPTQTQYVTQQTTYTQPVQTQRTVTTTTTTTDAGDPTLRGYRKPKKIQYIKDN